MEYICMNLDPTRLDCIKGVTEPVQTRLNWIQLDQQKDCLIIKDGRQLHLQLN